MLLRFWKRIGNIGLADEFESFKARQIVLTNRVSLMAGIITWIILVVLFSMMPNKDWNATRILILIAGILFCFIIFLNKWHFPNLAKWMLSWSTVFFILFISVFDKLWNAQYVSLNDFFVYRFLLFSSAIIPLLVFGTSNKMALFLNMLPSFVGTVFFDQLHKLFGVDAAQFGIHDANALTLNTIVGLAYLALTGFIYNHIAVAELTGRALAKKQKQLQLKNKELQHKNAFINEQNHEILTTSEELVAGNEALVMAQDVIQKQKQLLENQNKILEQKVAEQTEHLAKANDELMVSNNELGQFSYTLSHNLKAPVATLEGLLNLVHFDKMDKNNKEIFDYIKQSVKSMNQVFTDMNHMLEMRNQLYISSEKVSLRKLIDALYNNFYEEINVNNFQFNCSFNGEIKLNTNARRLSGALFQIISNAIKFRSTNRTPQLLIDYAENHDCCCIKVRDNGIGFDSSYFREKLFYPYQKFHEHFAGKGLGLYTAKIFVESIGGNIAIESKKDAYTQVEIRLKK